MIKTNTELKCNLCGKEERLRFVEIAMWLCEKDRDRVLKFVKRLKSARTRYPSVKSWLHKYKLGDKK